MRKDKQYQVAQKMKETMDQLGDVRSIEEWLAALNTAEVASMIYPIKETKNEKV